VNRSKTRWRRRASSIQAAALTALGRRAVLIADASAAELCEAAVDVARGIGTPGPLADALLALASACERTQDWRRAAELADEALVLFREAGDPYGAAGALGEQGYYDIVHGRLERAAQRLGEALELRRQLGDDRRLVEPLIDYAWLDVARGRGEAARQGFLDCLALARHVGDRFNIAEALAGLSTQAALDGQFADAARLAGASAAIHERIGAPPWESLSAGHESALDPARLALGESAFAALVAEGRGLSAAEAVARSQRAPAELAH
jgi:tetratricopeptide (TPR) repeat protein